MVISNSYVSLPEGIHPFWLNQNLPGFYGKNGSGQDAEEAAWPPQGPVGPAAMPVMGQPQMLMGGAAFGEGMDSGWGWGWDDVFFNVFYTTHVSGLDGMESFFLSF